MRHQARLRFSNQTKTNILQQSHLEVNLDGGVAFCRLLSWGNNGVAFRRRQWYLNKSLFWEFLSGQNAGRGRCHDMLQNLFSILCVGQSDVTMQKSFNADLAENRRHTLHDIYSTPADWRTLSKAQIKTKDSRRPHERSHFPTPNPSHKHIDRHIIATVEKYPKL